MRILVIGDSRNREECRQKFGQHTLVTELLSREILSQVDCVFDFEADPENANLYAEFTSIFFFVNAAYSTLHRYCQQAKSAPANLFGFAGMPEFLNRPVLEISLRMPALATNAAEACSRLNTAYCIVADHPGMVTPRVICTIINEAYVALDEGIASRPDIDLAMKLGTAYPWGPFEWCERIGVQNVYRLLRSLTEDDSEDRYAISVQLEKEANQRKSS